MSDVEYCGYPVDNCLVGTTLRKERDELKRKLRVAVEALDKIGSFYCFVDQCQAPVCLNARMARTALTQIKDEQGFYGMIKGSVEVIVDE